MYDVFADMGDQGIIVDESGDSVLGSNDFCAGGGG